MKILKKFIPYLIYMGLLLTVVVVGTIVVYWSQIWELVLLVVGVSAVVLLVVLLMAALIFAPIDKP